MPARNQIRINKTEIRDKGAYQCDLYYARDTPSVGFILNVFNSPTTESMSSTQTSIKSTMSSTAAHELHIQMVNSTNGNSTNGELFSVL